MDPAEREARRVWCAQRVPDDHVSVCPNESRIGEIDLANKDFFMASPNVVSFAVEQKLYDPKSGKPFNWKRAYSPNEVSAAGTNGTRVRLWRFFDLVAPSQESRPETPNMDFPFSVKPEKKLSVYDVMQMTRDKCEGTVFDTARGLQGGPFGNPNYLPRGFKLDGKTIQHCRASSASTGPSTSRSPRPGRGCPIRSAASSGWPSGRRTRPASCPSTPASPKSRALSRSATTGNSTGNRPAGRSTMSISTPRSSIPWPSRTSARPRKNGKKRRGPDPDHRQAAPWSSTRRTRPRPGKYLTDYCINNANLVINAWWKLGDDLLVKFNHLWIYDVKTRKQSLLPFPEWYLRALVEYNKLKPQEEKKG